MIKPSNLDIIKLLAIFKIFDEDEQRTIHKEACQNIGIPTLFDFNFQNYDPYEFALIHVSIAEQTKNVEQFIQYCSVNHNLDDEMKYRMFALLQNQVLAFDESEFLQEVFSNQIKELVNMSSHDYKIKTSNKKSIRVHMSDNEFLYRLPYTSNIFDYFEDKLATFIEMKILSTNNTYDIYEANKLADRYGLELTFIINDEKLQEKSIFLPTKIFQDLINKKQGQNVSFKVIPQDISSGYYDSDKQKRLQNNKNYFDNVFYLLSKDLYSGSYDDLFNPHYDYDGEKQNVFQEMVLSNIDVLKKSPNSFKYGLISWAEKRMKEGKMSSEQYQEIMLMNKKPDSKLLSRVKKVL